MRCRFQMLADGYIAFPLVNEPVTHAGLEAQFLHIAIEWSEVLMVQHARRHMDSIALIPDITFAADLGITVAFDQLEIGFRIAIVANKSPARHAMGAVAAALDIFVG